MKYLKFFYLLLLFVALSCTNKEERIVEQYADGKAKHVEQYIVNKDGSKQLIKETFYFPEEKKYIEGEYNAQKERNGKWMSWYENGKKNSQGTYKDGKLEGDYTVWHSNGEVFYTGEYKNGTRVGVWSYYDTLGNLIKKEELSR